MVVERGRRNDVVQSLGVACARRPTSRALSFSRAILACVSASSGRVKRPGTASVRARPDRRGGRGSLRVTVELSAAPDECSTTTLVTTLSVASTGTPPIARQYPLSRRTKCSGSPAISPRIATTESARIVAASNVSRTMDPGEATRGETVRRGSCAASPVETSAQIARPRPGKREIAAAVRVAIGSTSAQQSARGARACRRGR